MNTSPDQILQIPPVPAQPPKPNRTYEGYECAYAWITFVLAYLFCRVSPAVDHPFGALLFTLVLFGCGAAFAILRKSELTVYSVLVAVSAVVFSLSFFLSSNAVIHELSYLWILAAYIYWIYCACGNSIAPLGNATFCDVIKAILVMPWSSLGAFPAAAFGGGKSEGSKKIGKSILWIAVGLCAAVIPTAIVLNLLSYDEKFSALLDSIFILDFSAVWSHLGSLILAVPLAFLGFAYLIADSDHCHSDRMTAADADAAGKKIKVLPQLLVYFTILPMLVVYVLFFVSQFDYYVAAFGGKLPEGVSLYSGYARNGFFELCAVSGINAFALLMMVLFTRTGSDGRPSVFQRIFSAILSVFTLILIATAASKMILYIRILGLTRKRVYTMWFMLLLAFAFLYALIRQFAPKFNFVAFFVTTFVVLYAVIALVNVDGWIVKYNADRYLDGTLEEFDTAAMADLGDSAIPQMIRLADELVSSGRIVPNGIDVREAVKAREQSLYDLQTKGADWMKTIVTAAPDGQKNEDVRQYVDLLVYIAMWNNDNKASGDGFFAITLPKLRAEAALSGALAADGGAK